jgi:hypothetical protein
MAYRLGSNFLAYVTIRPQPWQSVLDKMGIRQWGTIMYRLADIDFSNVLDISLREPLSDEIDRQELDANLRSESAFSPTGELEKAVFGAA